MARSTAAKSSTTEKEALIFPVSLPVGNEQADVGRQFRVSRAGKKVLASREANTYIVWLDANARKLLNPGYDDHFQLLRMFSRLEH